jgi:hypothetical protein
MSMRTEALASSLVGVVSNATTRGGALRLCEVNPADSRDPTALARALLSRLQVASYTVVACGSSSASAAAAPHVRVLNGGVPCSIRGAGLEATLGDCDVRARGCTTHPIGKEIRCTNTLLVRSHRPSSSASTAVNAPLAAAATRPPCAWRYRTSFRICCSMLCRHVEQRVEGPW